MSKPETPNRVASSALVSLLRSCAKTLDKLAKEYKRMGWDLTAERLEAEASEHRRAANSFEQANVLLSDREGGASHAP
mgnify:CR=1 FL=1